ncbi:MAG: RHS repeat-associated core domain-containing protein, partial [Pyrinomonadaceae bacterium]
MHQVAVYVIDWDGSNLRQERIEVLDATSNAVLDTRSISSYANGKYLVWTLRGHVKLKFTQLAPAGYSAVVSGLFFDSRTNVARAANGATATAASTLDDGRLPVAAINSDRKGIHWGTDAATGSGWHDATNGAYPDWLQVDFSGTKTIDEIDVFCVQDNVSNPIEPTSTTTFSLYGITDFPVQYWNESAWVEVPGGNVTGNNLIWRKFNFASITTSKIRVLVNNTPAGPYSYSRVVELEAWSPASSSNNSASANLNWLVTDQLGTPRLIFDKTGSLAATKRHDYLPFGEELAAGTGGRTPQQGYVGDSTRQKFTQKERDNETGLDYFLARYYSSTQGRFTSPDPVYFQTDMTTDPQRFNLYEYARNNPLKFIDPEGEAIELTGDEEARKRQLEAARSAVGNQAGTYLYENQGKDGKYYVGVYTNGPNGK